ncbi:hypothetical protein CR513_34495, partial [Mucuna pruriens]
MYVTRPLSMYKRNPGALSEAPPAGPNSGYLVIFDEEAQTYCCFGLCKDNAIRDLPFPQNKNLTINYSSDGEEDLFVPVLNQPLSSNRYYTSNLEYITGFRVRVAQLTFLVSNSLKKLI